MMTTSTLGIFKPKTHLASILCNPYTIAYITSTPDSVQQALTTPAWKQAMDEEYIALMHNNTLELVPLQLHMHSWQQIIFQS